MLQKFRAIAPALLLISGALVLLITPVGRAAAGVALLAAGLTAMIAIQAFINIGVVVGVMPTTGLPLPFFSAGGTSISMLMAAVGILLSVSRSTAK